MNTTQASTHSVAARALLEAAREYARAGEIEAALESLEGAIESGPISADWWDRDPELQRLREDPRLRDLIQDVRIARAQ